MHTAAAVFDWMDAPDQGNTAGEERYTGGYFLASATDRQTWMAFRKSRTDTTVAKSTWSLLINRFSAYPLTPIQGGTTMAGCQGTCIRRADHSMLQTMRPAYSTTVATGVFSEDRGDDIPGDALRGNVSMFPSAAGTHLRVYLGRRY